MSDKPEPITTQFAKKEHTAVEVGGNPAPEENPADQQKIKVRALRTFHESADLKGNLVHPGDEFDCPRGRAAQLRANGLIEYASASDEKDIHGEADAKAIAARIKHRTDAEQAVEQHKTTPLRNPEMKLGEVPDSKTSKK